MAKRIKLKDLIKEGFTTSAFSTVGGLVTQRSINPISVPGMSELVEGEWFGEDKKRIDAGAFIEEVKKFSRMGEWIYREGSLRDVAKGLSELADKARIATLQETDDWFDKVTINKNMKTLGNTSGEFTKIAKEANSLQQRMESLYEDMGHILGRYYDLDEALDPVGKEDDDIDNDGDTDDSDDYLKKRRAAISKSMKKEDTDGVDNKDEAIKKAMGETYQTIKNRSTKRLKDIGN